MKRGQERLVDIVQRENLSDKRIVEAFRRIAREDFVPRHARSEAYRDRPVGLPGSQTTSQPSLIARMLDVAAPRSDERALEIGTGYGFQTALMAQLAAEVVSVERRPELAATARSNLERAGIDNVEVHVGDGTKGWPPGAPYGAVVVSATARSLPAPLADQTADDGRLVIPLLEPSGENVVLFVKRDGSLQRERLVTPARFVPLVSEG